MNPSLAETSPIDDEATALTVLLAAASIPTRHETLVALLDAERRGVALVVVAGTSDPDDVVTVTDRLLRLAPTDRTVGALAIATIRPDHDVPDRFDLDDAERWIEIDAIACDHGVELLDWFVVGRGVSRPRQLLNVPSRWNGARPPRGS
jgi:hypothetical protein